MKNPKALEDPSELQPAQLEVPPEEVPNTDPKPTAHSGPSRWSVGGKGNVAHVRVGVSPTTLCGEVIRPDGKPVQAGALYPPCTRCSAAINATVTGLGRRPASPSSLSQPENPEPSQPGVSDSLPGVGG